LIVIHLGSGTLERGALKVTGCHIFCSIILPCIFIGYRIFGGI
jgi:hypothetical protein